MDYKTKHQSREVSRMHFNFFLVTLHPFPNTTRFLKQFPHGKNYFVSLSITARNKTVGRGDHGEAPFTNLYLFPYLHVL